MTYGWAVVIILVVLAVLFYLGVFDTGSSAPKSCALPAGFTCSEFEMDGNGNIYLDLGQATGKSVTVTGLGCDVEAPNATVNPAVVIPNGGHAVVSVGALQCTGGSGDRFKGKLLVRYQPTGSSLARTVTGTITSPLTGNASGALMQGRWGGGTYRYYRSVSVTTSVSADLASFPAYFVLDTAALVAAGKMNSSCKDLRVTDSLMATSLDYEIEANTCNTTSTIVWFRIPQTGGSNYLAFIFYGNDTVADGQNRAGVWRSGYSLVYHLSDLSDSTGNCALTAYGGASSATGARGIANTSYAYDGVLARTSTAAGCNLHLSSIHGPSSMSVWANAASATSGSHYLFSDNCAELGIRETTNVYGMAYTSVNGGAFATGSWYHLAASHAHPNPSYANTTLRFFVNGAFKGTTNWTLNAENGYTDPPYHIGGDNCTAGYYFNGTIDEVRVSNVARSDDWIAAEYGQTASLGAEQQN